MQFCHTHYSFRYGTIAPKELIERAIAAEYEAIVIADINNTSAILNSIRLGQNKGLNVVPGIDFRNGVQQRFVAYCQRIMTGFPRIERVANSTSTRQGRNPRTGAQTAQLLHHLPVCGV
jgi:DNA polymerase III alpha subunit